MGNAIGFYVAGALLLGVSCLMLLFWLISLFTD
jgi:hypothetical protein